MEPGRENVVEKIMELTGGYGCDIYIEATGHPSSVTQGMQMIRKLGRFVEFSVFAQATTLDCPSSATARSWMCSAPI